MRRYKYPLMVAALFSTCMGLAFLYARLGLSTPFSLNVTLLLSAVASDYWTTMRAIRLGGKEANPVLNVFFRKVGAGKGGLVVVGLFVLMVIFMFKNAPSYQQLALASTYWIVPINNVFVIKRLRSELRKDSHT